MTGDKRTNLLLKGGLTPDRFPPTSVRRAIAYEATAKVAVKVVTEALEEHGCEG